MTPKEKAKNIVSDIYRTLLQNDFLQSYSVAIECALLTVDEILNNNSKIPGNADGLHTDANTNFWHEVKKEIEQL